MRTLVALVTLAGLVPLPAAAHAPSDSYLYLTVENRAVNGRWDLALRDMDFILGLDANEDGSITWGELKARRAALADYALTHLQLRDCSLQPGALQVIEHGGANYAALSLEGECVNAPQILDVNYHLLFDLDRAHRGLLRLRLQGVEQAAVFSPEQPRQSFAATQSGAGRLFLQYLREGVWHVLSGFDHLLFLAALLLPAALRRTRAGWIPAQSLREALLDTVRVVTAFTLAHALTLTIAASGWIMLPSRLVESLVAATVVFAGLNNLLPLVQQRLTALAFAFGLIHGAAIAGALIELGLPMQFRVLALLAFNLGVEGAQLALAAIVVPLFFRFRNSPAYRRWVLLPGCVAVTLTGLLWLIERALNLNILG